MSKEYIEDCDGNFYVAGTRISLDSIIHAFRRGESPETICQNFELLDLEQLYGAIAHYLAHKAKLMRISCVRIRSGLKAKESPKRFQRISVRGLCVLGTASNLLDFREGSLSRRC